MMRRRWPIRFIICLALGAVTTVAVAWGLHVRGFSDSPSYVVIAEGGQKRWHIYRFEVTGRLFLSAELNGGADEFSCTDERIPKWSRVRHLPASPEESIEAMADIAYGWPALAMRYSWHAATIRDSLEESLSVQGSLGRSNLPYYIIPRGFLFDTFAYGAIWFGLALGLGIARRKFRRMRNHCPKCAHDLRGNAEGITGCAECG